MTLRIGYLSTFYHTAALMIGQPELTRALGQSIDWRLFGTGPAIMDAFDKNELDLAYIGLPPAIIGIERGVRIKCIAGGHMEGTVFVGSDSYVTRPSLKETLAQFRGQTLGVPGKGSIHDVILKEYLREFSLKEEIEVINFRWADEIVDAMLKGQVNGAFGTPALAIAAKHFAHGKLLYPAGGIWPNNPSYGIVASDDIIHAEPELLKQFLLMHEKGNEMLRLHPDKAASIIAKMVGVIDKDFVLQTLQVSAKYCAALTDEYIISTMKFIPVLNNLGYISSELNEEQIFNKSLINEVHPQDDHY
jgi:NitT/TauT family transport system substrate-binding protein